MEGSVFSVIDHCAQSDMWTKKPGYLFLRQPGCSRIFDVSSQKLKGESRQTHSFPLNFTCSLALLEIDTLINSKLRSDNPY